MDIFFVILTSILGIAGLIYFCVLISRFVYWYMDFNKRYPNPNNIKEENDWLY
tara:strand:- start:11136 stop:11294 length:159 start_codon:yes stop_codon:yes gene_type:complete